MEDVLKAKLDEANKLIFVRQYRPAEKILGDLLAMPAGDAALVLHLRNIELMSKLNRLPELQRTYAGRLKRNPQDHVALIGIALVEHFGEQVPVIETVGRFQDIIRNHGPTAASHYGLALAMESQGNIDRAIFNYEQSIALDSQWFPSFFGLSQLNYQKGNDAQGDHFFFLFEEAAPYNVYGNFETHRRLSREFLEASRYAEAEAAVSTLTGWWLENKGICPTELRVYEHLTLSQIAEHQGDNLRAGNLRTQARALAEGMLDDESLHEGVLYFVAKIFEEHQDADTALSFYRKVLKVSGGSPATVQKIGSQFLSLGEYETARSLFEEAYKDYPDNPEIRFCLLVTKLKLATVNVEDYLIGKERLKKLLSESGDRVEILALLHSLVAKFDGDPDTHSAMGDVYLRLANPERAGKHFTRMNELDGLSRQSNLKFASYLMQHGDPDQALTLLQRIDTKPESLGRDDQAELFWLKANYFARKRDFQASHDLMHKVLHIDPWNTSYLVQATLNLSQLTKVEGDLSIIDNTLKKLANNDESDLDWREFDRITKTLSDQRANELAYLRQKLRYLYANGQTQVMNDLVKYSCAFDAQRGTFDFLRLLNTNFDGANLYLVLGILFKDLWQLETACMWFEQALLHVEISGEQKARTYLEFADTLTWRDRDLQKAIEYAQLAIDMSGSDGKDRAMTVLAHAYLKTGQVRQAQSFLERERTGTQDPETVYLLGLLHYRNGSRQKANQVWKPLLTVRSESLRFHNIKQEVLRYYFQGDPYLKAN